MWSRKIWWLAILPLKKLRKKSRWPNGISKTSNPCWQVGRQTPVSSLHDHSWGRQLYCVLAWQCSCPHSCSTPSFFPFGMKCGRAPQFLRENSVDFNHLSGLHTTFRLSKNANNCLPSNNSVLTDATTACWPKQNNMGINGSPCSPPSPCWITWTSIPQKNDVFPKEARTKNKIFLAVDHENSSNWLKTRNVIGNWLSGQLWTTNWSRNTLNVVLVPKTTDAPSKSCLPTNTSPYCTNWRTRWARISTLSTPFCVSIEPKPLTC